MQPPVIFILCLMSLSLVVVRRATVLTSISLFVPCRVLSWVLACQACWQLAAVFSALHGGAVGKLPPEQDRIYNLANIGEFAHETNTPLSGGVWR